MILETAVTEVWATLIDAASLAVHLHNPDWRVFDCRFDLADPAKGELAYAVGHIPGSLYAHLDRDLSGKVTATSGRHPLPDVDKLQTWLGTCGVDSCRQVVAYDDTGGTMAVRLWWLLRWLGHRRVAVLDGGWQAWCAAGLPVTTEMSVPGPVSFEGEEDPSLVVTTGELMQPSSRRVLVDVRTAERFRGECEPIDPVAGHIPGALNLPLQRNLGTEGRFLPAVQLRAMYQPLLAGGAPDCAVFMCGSGVTACHSILAMEVAGLCGARLYAGSWSEWIRDGRRPVATSA